MVRATPGVTPTVAVVGATGERPKTGRACPSTCGLTGRANPCTGCEVAIAAAGTTVAAPALRKWFMVTLLIVVLLIWLMFVTFRMFTLRT